MINKIKNLRVRIDGLARLTKESLENKSINGLEGFLESREMKESRDSLYLAKAWLGKILGELGTESPYSNDGNRKTAEDIEPTADTDTGMAASLIGYHHIGFIVQWNCMTHIEKVDWLRDEIKIILEEFKDLDTPKYDCIDYESLVMVNTHLSEARFWLGFELGRIKENNE